MDIRRRMVSEAFGTAALLAAIVGSGIMGERLAGGNAALALLANAVATGTALVAVILTLGPVSGGHFNPAVTLAVAGQGGLSRRDAAGYILAQLVGALAGVTSAHVMFDEPVFQLAGQVRAGGAQAFSEFVATLGLLTVVLGCSRRRPEWVPLAVGLYVTSACWFTASTSFANPAVTVARAFTDTLAGIRPVDVPGFVAAQLISTWVATLLVGWLIPPAILAAQGALAARGRRSA